MKRALFAELMESMHDALDHSRGKRELRTTVHPSAPAPMTAKEVRELRELLNASHAVFARVRWSHARGGREVAALLLCQLLNACDRRYLHAYPAW